MIVRFYFLISISLFFSLTNATANSLDSIGFEIINGKIYVLHQVKSGESIYAIATKYGTSVHKIIEISPKAKQILHVGMVIKVPYERKIIAISTKKRAYHIVKNGETLYAISKMYKISVNQLIEWNHLKFINLDVGKKLWLNEEPDQKSFLKKTKNIIHKVAQGEGLYSIARIYNITVDDIIKYNKLESTLLKVGQELIVKINVSSNYAHPTKTDTVQIVLKKHYEIDKIIESGVGSIINGSNNTMKYLALHRTAQIGSIISVKNEMNDQVVFVRVIGKLPNTGINSKIVIRISDVAYKKLGAIDSKFRVQLSYLPTK